jgi:hypothetical protein
VLVACREVTLDVNITDRLNRNDIEALLCEAE